MCGGVHYGEVEGLVSVERWSCSRGLSQGSRIHYGEVEDLLHCLTAPAPLSAQATLLISYASLTLLLCRGC